MDSLSLPFPIYPSFSSISSVAKQTHPPVCHTSALILHPLLFLGYQLDAKPHGRYLINCNSVCPVLFIPLPINTGPLHYSPGLLQLFSALEVPSSYIHSFHGPACSFLTKAHISSCPFCFKCFSDFLVL